MNHLIIFRVYFVCRVFILSFKHFEAIFHAFGATSHQMPTTNPKRLRKEICIYNVCVRVRINNEGLNANVVCQMVTVAAVAAAAVAVHRKTVLILNEHGNYHANYNHM